MGKLVRIALLVAILGVFAIGWYYSEQILGPDVPPPLDEQALFAVTDSSMTLEPNLDARSPGVSAVEWPGGYGELGERLDADPARITRRFRLESGTLPRVRKVSARPYAFAADPRSALGLDYREVLVWGPLGTCPAWRIDPTDSLLALGVARGMVDARSAVNSSSWVIYVHGRGATRAQGLSVAPLFLSMGWTVLDITYRGDKGAADDGDRGYHLGGTEWRDLEAAVRYALTNGADRVAIFGMSMGGGITLHFLRHSPLSSRIAGAILEAPVLRWRPVFDLAARDRGVPAPITSLGMEIAARRARLDWIDLDELAHSAELHTPLLVLHGSQDAKVPPALSDSLAARRPDLVTLVRVLGAGHARARNVDPAAYDATIAGWMRRKLEPAARPQVAASAR
jgi:pimeloyl-ACP methyl ester carboxylesterase